MKGPEPFIGGCGILLKLTQIEMPVEQGHQLRCDGYLAHMQTSPFERAQRDDIAFQLK